MDISTVVQSEYYSALVMLEESVKKCPAEIWNAPQDQNRTWQVAYHVLFYTHLYLQPTEQDFVPWPKARGEAQYFGPIFFEGNRAPLILEPYTQAEICEYLDFVRREVARQIPPLTFDAPSGFDWLRMNKLELQFYNIRHIQHHTGELYERLGARGHVKLDWSRAPMPVS